MFSSQPKNWKPVIRAVGLACVHLLFLISFTPGLDNAPRNLFKTEKDVQKFAKKIGMPAARIGKFFMDIQRKYRRPVIKKIGKVLRPLRTNQNWRLYGDGPKYHRRMEIWVDDKLQYRSQDKQYQWRESTWRYRRIRPIPVTCAKACKKKPRNRKGLSLLASQLARQEFSGTQKVEVRFVSDLFPGKNPRPTHGLIRKAPQWKLEEIFYGKGPCK